MIVWPKDARDALIYFFQPTQDIDVYVEDEGDEAFYTELFKRITPPRVRITRVFAAGNRQAVVEKAKNHNFEKRRALFLIDGDFEWVRDEPCPEVTGLFRLYAYCIENLLIHEQAAVQLVIEEGVLTEDKARLLLDFQAWLAEISGPLVDLFVWFAVLNLVKPEEPTVGIGVGAILKSAKKSVPSMDVTKVQELTTKVEEKVISSIGPQRAQEIHDKIRHRTSKLERCIDIVSGKDFLIPLVEFRIRKCTTNSLRHRPLRIRLARHCERSLFSGLADALDLAVK